MKMKNFLVEITFLASFNFIILILYKIKIKIKKNLTIVLVIYINFIDIFFSKIYNQTFKMYKKFSLYN